MAARMRKQHQEDVRAKIQASQIINRLTNHALSEEGDLMSQSQVAAAKILLGKALPDLSAVSLSGDPDNPLQHTISLGGVSEAALRELAALKIEGDERS